MHRQSVQIVKGDNDTCIFIALFISVQCILVFIGSYTILDCLWIPFDETFDYDKLARIMYLYDSDACGHERLKGKLITNIILSNNTFGLNVLPIRWEKAIATVSSRLSAKTRLYIQISLGFHVIWLLSAIEIIIATRNIKNMTVKKYSLLVFFYCCIFMIIFDISMAIVYVAHIQQSITKGMILRHSGWSVHLKLNSYDNFAGWLPMIASLCWIRGGVFLILNIYFSKRIRNIIGKIKNREFRQRIIHKIDRPIPEAKPYDTYDKDVLFYRAGEISPHVVNEHQSFYY